jgi:hypothetical protein
MFSSVAVLMFNYVTPKSDVADNDVPVWKNPITGLLSIFESFIKRFECVNAGPLNVKVAADRNMRQPSVPHKKSPVKQIAVQCPNTWSDYLTGSNSGKGDGSVIRRSGSGGATGSLGVSRIG